MNIIKEEDTQDYISKGPTSATTNFLLKLEDGYDVNRGTYLVLICEAVWFKANCMAKLLRFESKPITFRELNEERWHSFSESVTKSIEDNKHMFKDASCIPNKIII